MRVHFEKNYKKEAMEWFQQVFIVEMFQQVFIVEMVPTGVSSRKDEV
jgi:hypothetical protein